VSVPDAPPPIHTTQTDVTPAGAVHVYVPGVVYETEPQSAVYALYIVI
jgi:hypothetical protein